MGETPVGRVSHYFPRVGVAVVELSDDLREGEVVVITGRGGRLSQPVTSMQMGKVQVQAAKKGESIGLKVASRVYNGDRVLRLQ